MEDHAELAIAAEATRGSNLNDGAFQAAALRKDQTVSVKERLREGGFDFLALLRGRGAQWCHKSYVDGAAGGGRHGERSGNFRSQRLGAKIERLGELGEIDGSGVDVLGMDRKLGDGISFYSVELAGLMD